MLAGLHHLEFIIDERHARLTELIMMLGDYEAEIYLKSISSIRDPVFFLNSGGEVVYRSSGGAIYIEEIERALNVINKCIAVARSETKKFVELDINQLNIESSSISNVYVHLIHPTFAVIVLDLSPTAYFRSSNNPFRSDLNSIISTEILKSSALIDAGLNFPLNSDPSMTKIKNHLRNIGDLLILLDQVGIVYGSLFSSAAILINFYELVESQIFFLRQLGLNSIELRTDSKKNDVYIHGHESVIKKLVGDLLLQVARCNVNFKFGVKIEKTDGGVYFKIERFYSSDCSKTASEGQLNKFWWLIARELIRGIQGVFAIYDDAGRLLDNLYNLSRLEIFLPNRVDNVKQYFSGCSGCEAMTQADLIVRELVDYIKPAKSLAGISREEFAFISNVIFDEVSNGDRKL